MFRACPNLPSFLYSSMFASPAIGFLSTHPRTLVEFKISPLHGWPSESERRSNFSSQTTSCHSCEMTTHDERRFLLHRPSSHLGSNCRSRGVGVIEECQKPPDSSGCPSHFDVQIGGGEHDHSVTLNEQLRDRLVSRKPISTKPDCCNSRSSMEASIIGATNRVLYLRKFGIILSGIYYTNRILADNTKPRGSLLCRQIAAHCKILVVSGC